MEPLYTLVVFSAGHKKCLCDKCGKQVCKEVTFDIIDGYICS